MTDEPRETIEAVYLGCRQVAAGKLADAWIPLALLAELRPDDWDLTDRKASLFDRKRRKGAAAPIVAGVYQVEALLDDGQIRRAVFPGKHLRQFDDWDWQAAMSARHEANTLAHKAAAQLKKLAETSYLASELQRLKRAYKSCAYAERPAFEMAVLKHLRSA